MSKIDIIFNLRQIFWCYLCKKKHILLFPAWCDGWRWHNILTLVSFVSRRVKAGSITNHFGKTLHSNPSFFSSFLGCWYCRFRGVCACECVCVRGWRFWSESTTCTDVQTNASGETDRETARPKAFSNLSHDVHKASKYKLFVLLISLFFYNPMSMKHSCTGNGTLFTQP